MKASAHESREDAKEKPGGLAPWWRRWTGGRWIILKMILLFVLLHYFWDYVGEDLLGLPGKAVDPMGVFISAAIVYRIFLRDIESILYPEGAVGKRANPYTRSKEKRFPAGAGDTAGNAAGVAAASLEPVLPRAAAAASTRPFSILLVDEDHRYLKAARETLQAAGMGPVHILMDGGETLEFISTNGVALLLLGVDVSDASMLHLVERIRMEQPQLPVIVMTSTMDVETAVACMKAGAFDYLIKPVEKNRFLSSVRRALEFRELRSEISTLTEHLLSLTAEDCISFHGITTKNRKMQAICRYAEAVAPSMQPVLITGETGAGKELIARSIHGLSGRPGEFVALNVAGLDDAMFSDTMFGHRKGAYTGADQRRDGLLARASSGTLFLDEIGDLNESSQVKLLRLLEDKEYYPLGSDETVTTDARILCATHQSLPALMSAGEFRKDLFFRLQAHHVHIPALRERMEDLPLLLDQCLEEAASSLGKKKPTAPPELLKLLSAYHFPGNVRELRSMTFDAVAQHRTGVLALDSFREAVRKGHPGRAGGPPAPAFEADGMPIRSFEKFPTLKEATDYLVAEAMKRSGNNQGVAAILLGITREALNKRIIRQKRHAGEEQKNTDAA